MSKSKKKKYLDNHTYHMSKYADKDRLKCLDKYSFNSPESKWMREFMKDYKPLKLPESLRGKEAPDY